MRPGLPACWRFVSLDQTKFVFCDNQTNVRQFANAVNSGNYLEILRALSRAAARKSQDWHPIE
jgi:hypothetical protein